MSARLLSGRPAAAALQARLAADVDELKSQGDHRQLVVVTATDDPSSASYVRSLQRFGEKTGVAVRIADLGPDASAATIRSVLEAASADGSVHGVMLQTPLPDGASLSEFGSAIAVEKDVDGANPASLARLMSGEPCFAPATAAAVVELLDYYGVGLAGQPVTVVGRSLVVGKPLLHLLLNRDATVTVAHSRTADLAAATRGAAVVVAAAGRAGLIRDIHVAPGSVVIDVGTNFDADGALVGDVDAASVGGAAAALSPVPGGVGAITTALLFRHTVYGLPDPAGVPEVAAAGAAQ